MITPVRASSIIKEVYRDLFFQRNYLFITDLLTVSRFQRTLILTVALALTITLTLTLILTLKMPKVMVFM
jgi:hypothetical protein